MPENKREPMEVLASKEEKTIFSWKAAERLFHKRDREFWTTAITILILVSLILILVKEFFFIAALVALVFVYYALSSVPPEEVTIRLTNKGFHFGDLPRMDWEVILFFWEKKQFGQEQIFFKTALRFPGEFSFIVPEESLEKVKEILSRYIPEREESPRFLDKTSKWLAEKIPLEGNGEKGKTKNGK